VPEIPNTLAWIGIAFTVIGGPIAVWQLIQYFVDRGIKKRTKNHIRAMKQSMQDVRHTCNEAIEAADVLSTQASRSWVKAVLSNLKSVENHIDALLEIEQIEPQQGQKMQKSQKLVNSRIVSGNDLIKKIASDSGIPGSLAPSPEIKTNVAEWIQSTKSNVGHYFPEFIGQFMNDAGLVSDSPAIAFNKSSAHHELIRDVQNRLSRLGELLERI
jgi:hypothetical protein